jgi:Cu(I)/Ag(I) efflux system membrane fusion protein
MKQSIVLSVAAIAFAIAVGGCQGAPASSAVTATTEAFPRLVQGEGRQYLVLKSGDVPGMTYEEVREILLPGVLETTGQITFDDRRVSTIVSRVQGRIENVRVSVWDTVRRGEPILELYSPDFMSGEAEYLQAQNTSKISLNSGPDGSGDLAASMVIAARRKLELLGMEDADINALRAPSPTIWMRAPISGTVVQNEAVIGSAVAPGDVLYQLGTLDHVWITADIYEVDLARIQLGQELEAVTTTFPQDVFRGQIVRISPGIDPNSHTAQIRCDVNNPGGRLKPQMLARIQIVTRPGAALVVPQQALVFDGDAYYAFVQVAAERVERRKVEIGAWNERGYARVLAGLKPGERLIVKESIQVNALWHEALGESS